MREEGCVSEMDERPQSAEPIPVLEFEGEYVRIMEGKLPAITLEMPEGYARNTHLRLDVEVRIRNVHYDETGKGDLKRIHLLALEEVRLASAHAAGELDAGVGGSASGEASQTEYLHESADLVIDILDSSPKVRALLKEPHPGRAHGLDHLRSAVGREEPD